MLKITFDKESVQDAFICKLRDLGITNVKASSVEVNVKTLRDGSGGAEAEITFETENSSPATANAKDPAGKTNKKKVVELDDAGDDSGTTGTVDPSDSTVNDLFGKS